jgi:hypothetical protein
VVTTNVFEGNVCGTDGGGICVIYHEGNVVIEGNLFLDNTAGDHGGGLYVLINGTTVEPSEILRNLFIRNEAIGKGLGDTGSGGAMWVEKLTGTIAGNTMVYNIGRGETACSGGGLVLSKVSPDLNVYDNIIAFNDGCGIACRYAISTVLGPNLLWQNLEGDLGQGTGACPLEWSDAVTIADPLFCNPNADDFRLREGSPGIQDGTYMGYTDETCPGVPIKPTTWGALKTRYQ